MPPRAIPVLLLAGWAALPSLPSLPWDLHLPTSVERWLWNPRERTGKAIRAAGAGDPEGAAEDAATALRLAPEDPRVRYNAGTAELGARHLRQSVDLLEKAARDAPADLAPAVSYNLGNARLAAGDAAGAVEAYKRALRLAPDDVNAKHNLEIALREREKEQMRMKSPREGSRGDRPDDKDPSGGSGSGDPNDQKNQQDERRSDANDPGRDRQKGQPGPPQQSGPRPARPGDQGQPLPQFRNQPDMSAQEAAALLESVENLERQQRRKQAAERARQRSAQGKDW